MERWGIVDDDTGINLSVLYDLLREQFQYPDDSWCKETLKWWNECVLAFPSVGYRLFIDHTLAKSSQTSLTTTTGKASGIWRVQR